MRFFFPKFKSNKSTIFGCLIVLRETYQQKLLFILYYPLKPSILASPFLIHPQTWSTLQDPQRFNCDDSKRAICPWGSSSCPKVCASWAWKKNDRPTKRSQKFGARWTQSLRPSDVCQAKGRSTAEFQREIQWVGGQIYDVPMIAEWGGHPYYPKHTAGIPKVLMQIQVIR